MAEECSDSLITLEKNESDGTNVMKNSAANLGSLTKGRSTNSNHRRASIWSYHGGEVSVRSSTDKADFANSSRTAIPHYLRASTGSCHDFCKYGLKHSSEEKARKPVQKRIAKSLPNEPSMQITVSGEQTKEMVVNQKTLVDAMENSSPDVKPSPDAKSYSLKLKTSLDKKNVVKHKSTEDAKSHSPDLSSSNSKSYLWKPKMSSDAKTSSLRQSSSSGNKTLLPKYNRSSNEKFTSPDPPEIVKSVVFLSKQVEDPVKQGTLTDNQMSRAEKKTTYMSKQPSSQVKSKPVKVKASMSSDNSDGAAGKGRGSSDAETSRNAATSKASLKKVSARPTATSSPKLSIVSTASIKSKKGGNVKLLSPLKDRNRIRLVKTKTSNHEKVSEKTLHVIKTETVNNVSESIPDDPLISSLPLSSSAQSLSHAKSSSLSSHEEDNKETEQIVGEAEADEIISHDSQSLETDKTLPVKDNHNKTPRKSRAIVSEDKPSSVKLKFRSGKILDLQNDNNSPRRLRFRRARAIGAEEGKGDLRRRTFRKAGPNYDATGAERSSENVVLKHQDVQGKKDAQGLFNNVIEETASKLVESRKSKVKALVGAFETVISLQESKPSAQAVSCV
ncbi:hypothetical protein CDL12_17407 [Handroanthus impetiginosus]|uniref:Calmodulin-binding domain-containing protein n=1 Tax=Handroanthus impetiginosus TaxID=429701 RepID=A0A2G9GXK2_9LAMI|nr:hypothetical protein CDL12_17407 [Handroanthus impetiginosus]